MSQLIHENSAASAAASTTLRFLHLFADRQVRYASYGMIACALFVLAVTARSFQSWRTGEPLNFIVSDAKGYYVYLPSILIDGDVDFLNQMLATYEEDLHRIDYDIFRRTDTGVVHNKYPVGMALTLAPPFLAAHGVAMIGQRVSDSDWFVDDGYSPTYQLFTLAMILALSGATMLLLDRLIEQHFDIDGRAIAAGVITFWLGSHYAWYCFREPFMVHVVSAFWVTATVFCCAKLRRDAFVGRVLSLDVFLVTLACTMAILTRPTNVFVAPFLIWALLGAYRAGVMRALVRALPAGIPGLLPILAQLLVWRAMHGQWFHYSYGGERFVWTSPALLQTLFSLHKGLFLWTPLLLLAVGGVAWHVARANRRNRGIVACWILSAAILWYLNSAWWAWGFGWSFGARAFLELAGLFVLGLVLLFELARRHSRVARNFVIATTVALVVFNYTLMGLYQTRRINRGDWEVGGWHQDAAPERFLEHIEKVRNTQVNASER